MADENGSVLSPSDMGTPDGHPITTEVRVELRDVDGRTNMVMTHSGIPADSPGAPDGGWRSTSSPPTSKHTATDSAGHLGLGAMSRPGARVCMGKQPLDTALTLTISHGSW
jgi:hypothetical protein